MKPRIKLLDQHCINQIAAGEVVERPLSVIKELIENSLDASAKKVELSVEGGGTSFIRVKDDGHGILPDDLRLAVLPHATSKISSIDDLNTLQTLGFRGEALPSIASVSRLSILSRTGEELSGYEIQVEGGSLISATELGCPIGTTVTVKDLFFNTPARQKFLRSNSTEFGLISDMVSRLALARPDVSFTLRHPNNLILNTPGKGNLLETIAAVIGNQTARKMIAVSHEDQNLKVSGYISPPDLVRSSMNGVTFLVNGRVIRSQLLNQALKEGYYTMIHAGTYPISVLALTMPPSFYDVNVHPAKLEIKFKEEKELGTKLASIIRSTLLAEKPLRSLSFVSGENTQFPFAQKETKDKITQKGLYQSEKESNIEHKRETNGITDTGTNNQEFNYQKAPSSSQNNWEQLQLLYSPWSQDNTGKENFPGEERQLTKEIAESDKTVFSYGERAGSERTPFLFEELRALGQLFQTYILCTNEKSLYIIDQHAAHERIKYDKLSEVIKQNKMSSQLLLIPETVDLTLQEESLLLEHFVQLREMGFIIEHFGERTYFLRGVPVLHNLENPGKIFRLFLDEILTNPMPPTREKLLEEWIFMLACRSAIKGNERLSIQEMDELIQQLGTTVNPHSCPHGRPTIIEISKQELEKRFNR